jgi:hypothetical protein
MTVEFTQPASTPHPLGLRGVAHDPGNFNFLALVNPPTPLPEPRITPWHRTTVSVFNQRGSSCTAQAAVGVLTTLPFRYQFQPDRAGYDSEAERHQLYLDAQGVDPWPGGEPDYEGSSSDAPYRILRDRSVIASWNHIMGEEELWEWVSFYSPASVGTVWTDDMFDPDSAGFIWPTGPEVGGHAYEIVFASHLRQAYRMINSWSASWGQNGRAWITRAAMASLLEWDGEAVTVRL